MTSIDRLICETVNPFDSTLFRPGNFWQESHDTRSAIDEIHHEIVTAIDHTVDQTIADQRSRTILLAGDSGAGKSHLLGRLKRELNRKAFFAYVGPWPERDYIWRHTLRYTIDSLMYVPDSQRESQLLLWLRGLISTRDAGLVDRLLGARSTFVRNLKAAHPVGIYNANEFFSVLFHLTDPDRYALACEWLKGDELDEESLRLLNVNSAIDTESKAQNILGNFGRLASTNQPIVLCFDNLDNVDRSERGHIDLQALFNVNSIIHNQKLKNFVVIVSIITNTWNDNAKHIQPADLARIDEHLRLKPIALQLAKLLWRLRLAPLHHQTQAPPPSEIYPLSQADLDRKFPGGRALPRSVLMLGRQCFQEAKHAIQAGRSPLDRGEFTPDHVGVLHPLEPIAPIPPIVNTSTPITTALPIAAFQLRWRETLRLNRDRVTHMRQFSEPERIRMLRQVLEVLGVCGVQPQILASRTYSRYSLGFYWSFEVGRVGVIWVEEPNLVSFCNVMKACQTALRDNACEFLYLIRAESLGIPRNQGYRRYRELFVDSVHRHIVPDLDSMQILVSYHELLTAALGGDLILDDRPVHPSELQQLTRDTGVLQESCLLQELGAFGSDLSSLLSPDREEHRAAGLDRSVADFIFALVQTQQLMGRLVLRETAAAQLSRSIARSSV
ncbi:MAG: ATP-binding protein [Oscillatoriales cyanobacterium]|nr:MAG: ATP-binding protein [Oscillatoriales cyanobacterium]